MPRIVMSTWDIPSDVVASSPVESLCQAFGDAWTWFHRYTETTPVRWNDYAAVKIAVDRYLESRGPGDVERLRAIAIEALHLVAVWRSYARREHYDEPWPTTPTPQVHYHRDISTRGGKLKIPNGPRIELPGFDRHDLRTVGLSIVKAERGWVAKVFSVAPEEERGETLQTIQGALGADGMNSVSLQMLDLPLVREVRARHTGSAEDATIADPVTPKPQRQERQRLVLSGLHEVTFPSHPIFAKMDEARRFTWDFIYTAVYGTPEFGSRSKPLDRWQMLRSALVSGQALRAEILAPIWGVPLDFIYHTYLDFKSDHDLARGDLRGPLQPASRELAGTPLVIRSRFSVEAGALVLTKPLYFYEDDHLGAPWTAYIEALEALGWSRRGALRDYKTFWSLRIPVPGLPDLSDLLLTLELFCTEDGWRGTIRERGEETTKEMRDEQRLQAWRSRQATSSVA